MLSLNLQPVFRARGIQKPYSFLVKAGFPPYTAHNLLNSKSMSFRLRHIDKLCTVLNCTPNDIFVWAPNRNEKLEDTHPLTSLKNQDPDYNWQDTIRTIPLNQLQQLVSIIKSANAPKKEE